MMRKAGIGFLIGLAGILLLRLSLFLFMLYQAPLRNVTTEQLFIVQKNSSTWSICQQLAQQGYIFSPKTLYYWLRMKGNAKRFQAGVYPVHPGDSLQTLLQRILHGQVLRISFTIIAGTTWPQIYSNLQKATWISMDELQNKTWLEGDASNNMEGLFLADTWIYDANSKASALLLHSNKALSQVLQRSWQERKPRLPYRSPRELLIAASIIEKETALPQEKPLIAAVIANRLEKGMRLQMDPTVIYALGKQWAGKLHKKDLQFDSPYNTYQYRGLPPGPIAMVSRDSIAAAAQPASTTALYFVARGDGSHAFSNNYPQQQEAIQRYIKRKTE